VAHPAQKKFECKNPLDNFSPQFFVIKRGVLPVGSTDGPFEGKTPREATKGVLFLQNKDSVHRALANQNWPT
jgi:hypothetical protein